MIMAVAGKQTPQKHVTMASLASTTDRARGDYTAGEGLSLTLSNE